MTILHVDMDAFFASVEQRRHPELRGRPVVVGGTGERGVVAAASYEARAFGVHSAMPAVRARRLCPDAVFLPGDHAHYCEVSAHVMEVFRGITPLVEPISLDEAFLDVSGARRLLGEPLEIARLIRQRVRDAEGLECAVGLARVKFLAKLASQAAKPRATAAGIRPGAGVVVVDPDREEEFLHPLPVKALWGVGPATLGRLERLGIRTVGQLAETPVEALVSSVGAAHGRHLHNLANLVDDRGVETDREVKSVSHEQTFAHDHHGRDQLAVEALRLSDSVASRLRAGGLSGRTISIKVRFGDFHTITRSFTLAERTDSAREIADCARTLLDGVDPSAGVRLLGVSVSGLDHGTVRQLAFDLDSAADDGDGVEPQGSGWVEVEAAVDAVRARFGDRALGPASLMGRDGLKVARRGDQQWGPEHSK